MLGPFLTWRKILDVNNFKIIESVFIDFHLTLPNRETEKDRKGKDVKGHLTCRVTRDEHQSIGGGLDAATMPGFLDDTEGSWAVSPVILVRFLKYRHLCTGDFQSQAAKLFLQAARAIIGTSLKTESGFQWEEVQIEIRNTLRWLILSKSFPYNFKVTI